MKFKVIFITSLLFLLSLTSQAQDVYQKLEVRKDITSVHISKSLLGMLSKVNAGGADLGKLADKLKQMDIYTSESMDAVTFMKAQINYFATNKAYESFITMKENNQVVQFFGQKSGDKFKELVMISEQKDKCIIVSLIGSFTAQDIQGVINK